MQHGSTLLLKIVVSVIGLAVLALCLLLLWVATETVSIDDYLTVLIGMYTAAPPFFFAVYQTLLLLSLIDRGQAFSDRSVRALRMIKFCGLVIATIYALTFPFIIQVAERDDAPGAVAIGAIIILASAAIATLAAVLERLLREALAMKAENELTV